MRVRTTAVAVIVVGLALLLGAMALLTVLRDTLTDNVRTAAEFRATEIAAVLESGAEPPALTVSEADEQLIQVLDETGKVLASSDNVAGQPPVVRIRPGQVREIDTPVDEDRFLAVAVAADTPDGPRTVIVARALADALESTDVITRLLMVGLPILLVLVGVTTWTVVGRALAPVEGIRREADSVTAAELYRRVPEPESGDEVWRLARTMNRMLDRLESAQASQRRFVSDVSHELRSPVTSIRQHVEVAIAHPARTTVDGLAEPVHAEALRMQRLVDDLLLLARADEAGLVLRRTTVDLEVLVRDEAERLAAGQVRVDTSEVTPARGYGDPPALRRVLRNLADNAVRHAAAAVTFSLAERDGVVLLAVDDDGPGIPESERAHVLERFVRLDDARARDDGGSGLGLAIVSELVRAHGGAVTITDSELGGARVEVRLPAA